VTLPLAAAQKTSLRDTFSDEPRARLLLVDDRRENLIALEAVLESLGEEMVLARSGTEALRHLLTEDFAVILLDVQMPDMDGFETAALIKEREKSRHIPIIFVTAINKDEKYVFRGYTAGAVDYLAKPIDPDMLRAKVSVFIDLYKKSEKIKQQAERLRQAELLEVELKQQEEERQRERRHLAELEAREALLSEFKSTLDATLDAVFLFDPQTLKFIYLNQGAIRLLGYSEEEARNLTPLDLDADGGRAELSNILEPLRQGELTVQQYETRCRRKDGEVVPVEVITQYVAPPGGRARFVSIVRDITERKRTEAHLALLYERERRIAEALQQSIVQTPPEDLFPGLIIKTFYQAAWDEASVGGDYQDVFALEGGRVALVVGDVSGKGLAAAARTAEVKYALRAFLRESPDPGRALSRLNSLLCDTTRMDAPDMSGNGLGCSGFTCVSVAVLNQESGEATLAIAGAEPPLLIRRDGTSEVATTNGMPLGIEADVEHQSVTYQLDKGDALLLVTDGITEARKGRNFFGYEGMVAAAEEAIAQGSIAQVGKSVLEAARDFAGGKLTDDACLLIAGRR
jgi:PAS domain S-box-containing protein